LKIKNNELMSTCLERDELLWLNNDLSTKIELLKHQVFELEALVAKKKAVKNKKDFINTNFKK